MSKNNIPGRKGYGSTDKYGSVDGNIRRIISELKNVLNQPNHRILGVGFV
jgi:hypothetical protein